MHTNNNSKMLPRYSSICIPRVDATIKSSYIHNIISNLNIGHIEHINEIPLRNDAAYKRVIITMKWDVKSEVAKYIQNKFNEIGSVKVVHDTPWYWKICPAR